MEKLHQWIDWAETHPKVWLDCVRIYLGLGLFIRGLFIITNTRAEFVQALIEQMHYPWIITVGLLHYVALAHLIGGLMLTFGLLTRIAAWTQVPITLDDPATAFNGVWGTSPSEVWIVGTGGEILKLAR